MEAIDAKGVARAIALFRHHFGVHDAPTIAAAAPGRINIIGEHTDYNDGYVFPLALEKNTYIVGAPYHTAGSDCLVVADAFPGEVARFPPADPAKDAPSQTTNSQHREEQTSIHQINDLHQPDEHQEHIQHLPHPPPPSSSARLSDAEARSTTTTPAWDENTTDMPSIPEWANYVRGMVAMYTRDGHAVPPFRAAIVSDVPMGGGLSSSAALEMATALFLEQLLPIENPDPSHRARLGQTCEHEFAGVPCGIMDQLVSSRGKPHTALLIDCRTLDCTPVPLHDPDVVLFVANSNVRHHLSGSEYPTRRAQCAEAARAVAAAFPHLKISHLRDVTLDQLESVRDHISPESAKRARHVILEDRRTLDTKAAFERGDYATAGRNMLESHESLRDLFEVSTPEIDALVDIAMGVDGVYGSRITGGGFGGCTVSLVRKDAVDNLIAAVNDQYPKRSGNKKASMFSTAAGPGARVLSHLI